jgi:predicted benzoate:H+ symporter BenE
MLALTILISGLLVVFVIAAVVFIALGMTSLFAWMIPVIPGLVAIGTFMLAGIELLMVFGGPEDRKVAKRDLSLFIPVIAVSGLLSWFLALFLWH